MLVVVALGILTLLLTGGGATGAAPAPKPTVAPASSPRPLQVSLPGLLTLSVDLPEVKLEVLGGSTAAARPSAAPTTASTTAATKPARSAAPPPGAAPAPVRTDPAGAEPTRSTTRANRGRTSTSGRVVAVADRAGSVPVAPKPKSATPSTAAPRPVVEAFQGMLHTGLPIWALAGVVAMCGLGTVLVVRSAGRRPLKARPRA